MRKRSLEELSTGGNKRTTAAVSTAVADAGTLLHPGVVLRVQFLEASKVTQQEFANVLGVSYQRLNGILNGLRSIIPDTALRLALATGTTPELWLQLQLNYDLSRERILHNINAEVTKRLADFCSSKFGHGSTQVKANKHSTGRSTHYGA